MLLLCLSTDTYMKTSQNFKVAYAVFIGKSCVYGVFVGFLVWKLQVCPELAQNMAPSLIIIVVQKAYYVVGSCCILQSSGGKEKF